MTPFMERFEVADLRSAAGSTRHRNSETAAADSGFNATSLRVTDTLSVAFRRTAAGPATHRQP
jgi:hypothetical protein